MTTPVLLFAHGAGAGSSHPWMQQWADRLGALGRVETFDYPYMAAGRRPPNRLPVLIDAHRTALAKVRTSDPVILIGKSMGSRVGCHVCLVERVHGVVCLGYPLVGAKSKRDGQRKVRDEVLLAMATPVHFVQGSADRMCPLEHLADVRSRMSIATSLHVVDGGDHSLQVGKRALKASERTQESEDQASLDSIGDFVSRLL